MRAKEQFANKWELDAKFREGEIKGEIKTIRILQGLLGESPGEEQELRSLSCRDKVQAITSDLQEKLRNR